MCDCLQVLRIMTLFHGVKSLDLTLLKSIGNKQLGSLSTLTSLAALRLRGNTVIAYDLPFLECLPRLTHLDLEDLEDSGFLSLSALTALKRLSWNHGRAVDDMGLAALFSCARLQVKLIARRGC